MKTAKEWAAIFITEGYTAERSVEAVREEMRQELASNLDNEIKHSEANERGNHGHKFATLAYRHVARIVRDFGRRP